MVAVYCYLEEENDKVLKFYQNNFCYFERSALPFQVAPSKKPPLYEEGGHPSIFLYFSHTHHVYRTINLLQPLRIVVVDESLTLRSPHQVKITITLHLLLFPLRGGKMQDSSYKNQPSWFHRSDAITTI